MSIAGGGPSPRTGNLLDGTNTTDGPPMEQEAAEAQVGDITNPVTSGKGQLNLHPGGDSSDDDDIILRRPPMARLSNAVARLSDSSNGEESETEGKNSGKAAYARVKALLGRTARPDLKAVEDAAPGSDIVQSPKKIRKRLLSHRRSTRSPSPVDEQSRHSTPGLFVSPAKSNGSDSAGSDPQYDSDAGSDALPDDPLRKERLQERVKQIRNARLEAARDAESAKDRTLEAAIDVDMDDGDDPEVVTQLTNSSRPTRGASKRALEEMTRETQRVLRNEQWGHKAITKKRFTTKDLFARLNYKPEPVTAEPPHPKTNFDVGVDVSTVTEEAAIARSAPTTADSSEAGDFEHRGAETPPTSPPSGGENVKVDSHTVEPEADKPLPEVQSLLLYPTIRLDKGKHRAFDQDNAPDPMRVVPPKFISVPSKVDNPASSDDELEILPVAPKSRFTVFDRVPLRRKEKQTPALLLQRIMAKGTSPGKVASRKRKSGLSTNAKQVNAQLLLRMREQARLDSDEKRRTKFGDDEHAYTTAQKRDDANWIQDTLEKERQADAKRAKKEAAEFDDDGLSDEDYVDEPAKSAEQSDGNADGDEDSEESSSDEEVYDEEEESEDEAVDDEMALDNPYFSDEAEDDNDETNDAKQNAEEYLPISEAAAGEVQSEDGGVRPSHINGQFEPRPQTLRAGKRRQVIDDDEDEDEPQEQNNSAVSPQSPGLKAFAFAKQPAPLMTATQLFECTMTDSSAAGDVDGAGALSFPEAPQYMSPPVPDVAQVTGFSIDDASPALVLNSQFSTEETPVAAQTPSLAQKYTSASPLSQRSAPAFPDDFSQMPDVTQDGGFAATPEQFERPHSTVDTILVPELESPVIEKRKGRLRRRNELVNVASDSEEDGIARPDHSQPMLSHAPDAVDNAFDVMRKQAQRKTQISFDKKKSEAKNIVDEQAEESEDEWAGLGGASDDESTGEVDEEVQKMLNDDNDEVVDERAMAAIHAEREVEDSKKQTEQIYRDIKTGKWRQNRRGGFDLSDDEDDERERRRRMFREDQRRSKALKAQGSGYEKLAENPKKRAFWQTLEDREDTLDVGFLDALPDVPSNAIIDSQPQSADVTGHPNDGSEPSSAVPSTDPGSRKRKASLSFPSMDHRRSNPNKRAANLLEIQESLSFLIDEPDTIPESQFSEGDDDENDYDDPAAATASKAARATGSVINRLVREPLADASASSLNADRGADGDAPMAFYSSKHAAPMFKVPALLRRATTNMSTASNASSASGSGASTPTGGREGGVKRGGSKKSNIHYQAREAERRKLIEEADRRRKAGVKKKIAGRREGSSVLRSLAGVGKGGFE